jgi:hypothetical protein
LWTELSEQIYGFLSGITLGKLVDQGAEREAARKDAARNGVAVNVDPVQRTADTV